MENKCSPHHDPYKALQRLTGRIELEENCQFPRGLLRFVSQILIGFPMLCLFNGSDAGSQLLNS